MTRNLGVGVGICLIGLAAAACGEPFEEAPGAGGSGASASGAGGEGGETSCSPGKTESCYEGPAGTENVGLCKGGTKVCNAEGNGFGECQGSTVPAAADDCGTPEDENCDGSVNDGCPCAPGAVEPCYSGPAGTADVGLCTSGEHMCGEDSTWGACSGEVLPAEEVCGNGIDEDCNGFDCSETMWGKLFGLADGEGAEAVATDSTGNVYLSGGFYGALQFGTLPTILSSGDSDVFVTKLDPAGEPIWSTGFGGVDNQRVFEIASDASGNVFAAGQYTSQMSAGGTTIAGSAVFGRYLCKILDDGAFGWLVRAWGDDDVGQTVVAVDSTGSPLIAGAYDAPPAGETDSSGASLAKYSTAGQLLWRANVTGSGEVSVAALQVDGADNAVLVGTFTGSLQVGDKTIPTSALIRSFLAKVNPDGSAILLKAFESTESTTVLSVATSASGDSVIAGQFHGTAEFGATTLVSAGDGDIFVAGISAGGSAIWAKRYGGPGNDNTTAVSLDSASNVVLTGTVSGEFSFGDEVLTAQGWGGMYVAKLDDTGNHLWSRGFDGDLLDLSFDVAIGPDDSVTIAGGTFSSLDFGLGVLANQGTSDVAVVKMAP